MVVDRSDNHYFPSRVDGNFSLVASSRELGQQNLISPLLQHAGLSDNGNARTNQKGLNLRAEKKKRPKGGAMHKESVSPQWRFEESKDVHAVLIFELRSI